jgi:protein phosphatase 1L
MYQTPIHGSKSICSSVALLIFLLVNICACSEDGSLNCGYSSIRGRRPGMEDFYDIKSSRIDDKQINFFGVFDGRHSLLEHLICPI